MNVCGLTDSLANVVPEAKKCPQCDGVSHLANGLCLACLMQAGLDNRDEGNIESFDSAIVKIDIQDTAWRIGPYEILEEIARGGMGVVYRARQQFSRRIVALKRVLAYHSDSAASLARFRREAEAASALDHPNILPIYEVGESEDGLPFFAMKFAPGGSLREVGPALHRSPERIVPLMLQAVRAIEYAHGRGLLHRDLKPGNILLDGRGQPLVSDFGLAKWLEDCSDLTQTLTVFGTPGYIAPEQARGPAKAVGPAADIYSLGAILFDLLAGRPPFLGEHAFSVVTQAMQQPAPRLRSLKSSIDRDLETICAHCLEREPAARYASATELAHDLECWIKGRSIVARPISVPARAWRWARRNPALAAAGAACLLLASLSVEKFVESRRLHAARQNDSVFEHSVTVLPFLNLDTALAEDETPGRLSGSLHSQLSRIGPSRVVQTKSSEMVFAPAPRVEELVGAARHAGVRMVLTGTKRLVDGKPIFSAHLVDPTRPDVVLIPLVAASPDKTTAADIQIDAGEFYKLLGTPSRELTRSRQENKIAADFIAAGKMLMDHRTTADCDRAIECFEKAVAADPQSAQAHGFLAIARAGRVFMGGRPELRELAEQSATKAIELDPRSAEGHRARAMVFEQKGDFGAAREEAFRAIEVNGVNDRSVTSLAALNRMLGRSDLAMRWNEISRHSSTGWRGHEFISADCWADLCEDVRAEHAYRQGMQLRPDLPEGWMGISRLRMLKGDFFAAIHDFSEQEKHFSQFEFTSQMAAQLRFFARQFAEAKKMYAELARKDPDGGGNFYGAVSYQSALGRLQIATGEKALGQTTLNRALQHELAKLVTGPHHPETLYRIAAIESSLGMRQPALNHLRAAFKEGWIDFRSLRLDPRFDGLRNDPTFQEIFESIATRVASLQRSMPAD